jgi:toxin ParE1/3/4
MSLPVILSPTAEREFEAVATWYEQHAGLGERFVERIQEALNRIGAMPEHHAVIHKNVRRVRLAGLPYNVYYRILDDRIEVLAVFHNFCLFIVIGIPILTGRAHH